VSVKRSFTLIELILVVLLISLVTFLVIKLPVFKTKYGFDNLRELLYPNGEIYIFKNSVLILKNGKKIKAEFSYNPFEVYGENFEKIDFGTKNGKKVLFHYRIKNGIGDVLIVKEKRVYFFKPLWVLKFDSLDEAKKYVDSLEPEMGRYY